MLPKQVSQKVIQSIDRYLVVMILGATSGGIYATVYLLPSFLQKFSSLLNPTLYPIVVQAWEEGDVESIEKTYSEILHWYTIIIIPGAFGVSLLAKPTLELMSTSEIAENGLIVVPIIAAGFVIHGYGDLTVYILNAVEDTGRIASANIIGAILNLALNLFLIPIFGIVGAAVATLVSLTSMTLVIFVSIRNILNLNINILIVAKSVFSSCLMAVVLIQIPVYGIQKLILYPVIGFFVYFIAMLGLGEALIGDLRSALAEI